MLTRREIKNLLLPYSGADGVARPLTQVAVDCLIWLTLVVAVAAPTPMWLKPFLAVLIGMWSARLFVLGHDACHGSLTDSPPHNHLLGRIAFLPTLTPFSLWEVGHNIAHHGFNNLRGKDFVWTPLSRGEYDTLPLWRQRLERLYRSPWGMGLYYLNEIWWRKLFFPNQKEMPSRRESFEADSTLCAAFAAVWAAVLILGGAVTGQSILALLVLGLVLPFLVWCHIMGFVVYVQHTHPSVRWYDSKEKWSADQAFLTGTVHVQLWPLASRFLHHIMEHTAHHVDMSVPYDKLQKAQAQLEQNLPAAVVVQPFTWNWFVRTTRECQLYDYEAQRWEQFNGAPAAPTLGGPDRHA